MSWIRSTLSHPTTRWVAGGLLALGGWAFYQSTEAQAQQGPSVPDTASTAPAANADDTMSADSVQTEPVMEPASHDGAPYREPVRAGSASADRTEALVQRRLQAERNHLWRVAAWGGANVIGGLALAATHDRTDQSDWWGFATQSAAWGAVNIGIATVGLLGSRDVPSTRRAAFDAERTYHDILLVNMGLNVGYSAVGSAMVIASYNGVDSASSWRGHGTALILQGAGLLLLDTIAWAGSRTRLTDLLDLPGSLSAQVAPTGASVTWRL